MLVAGLAYDSGWLLEKGSIASCGWSSCWMAECRDLASFTCCTNIFPAAAQKLGRSVLTKSVSFFFLVLLVYSIALRLSLVRFWQSLVMCVRVRSVPGQCGLGSQSRQRRNAVSVIVVTIICCVGRCFFTFLIRFSTFVLVRPKFWIFRLDSHLWSDAKVTLVLVSSSCIFLITKSFVYSCVFGLPIE